MLRFMLHISYEALYLFLRITPKGRCHEYGQVLERLSIWPVSLEEVAVLKEEVRSSGGKFRALSIPAGLSLNQISSQCLKSSPGQSETRI